MTEEELLDEAYSEAKDILDFIGKVIETKKVNCAHLATTVEDTRSLYNLLTKYAIHVAKKMEKK